MSTDDTRTDGRLHPSAVRVTVVGTRAELGLSPVVVEPPAVPLGAGAGGPARGVPSSEGPPERPVPSVAPPSSPPGARRSAAIALGHVEGAVVGVALTWLDRVRAVVERVGSDDPDDHQDLGRRAPTRVLLLDPEDSGTGPREREVVVDGWSIRVAVEPERRAVLRERASRGRGGTASGGPTDIRAAIPGRVLAVAVAAGDEVSAGQELLVVEAMKMQNEVRAPRAGTVRSVEAVPGRTIELGDLLVVLE